mmetsp:Transcript_37565/g.88870  ORF Transcript_37565/g.88870 Transcript_37565/m.88870 type:complete len:215 (+) Transcript_37565:1522-2166(+)
MRSRRLPPRCRPVLTAPRPPCGRRSPPKPRSYATRWRRWCTSSAARRGGASPRPSRRCGRGRTSTRRSSHARCSSAWTPRFRGSVRRGRRCSTWSTLSAKRLSLPRRSRPTCGPSRGRQTAAASRKAVPCSTASTRYVSRGPGGCRTFSGHSRLPGRTRKPSLTPHALPDPRRARRNPLTVPRRAKTVPRRARPVVRLARLVRGGRTEAIRRCG